MDKIVQDFQLLFSAFPLNRPFSYEPPILIHITYLYMAAIAIAEVSEVKS